MRIIGLTGGIGSGKSLVAKILKEKYHAYLLNTDGIARAQMEQGGASYQAVVEYFGTGILSDDGSIDRAKLAAIIFEDKEKRLKINELTHPRVLEEVKAEIALVRKQNLAPYVVVETALMIEAGYDYICDEVWYVHAPEDIRRERLKRERSYSDEKIDTIFENQSKPEAFLARFSKIIENTGDIIDLEVKIAALLNEGINH